MRASKQIAPRRGLDLWICLALAVAVFGIYFQTRHFGFIDYDDPEFVTNNVHIRDGLTPAAVAWAFRTGYAANWFPLTWLSYMLGVSIYGLSSAGHHLTNAFLHALNSILLFFVLRRMTGARWQSAFTAMIFAVHPLHVEPVAWVSQRRELLAGMFWMLSIGTYLRYVKQPRTPVYLLLVLAFACGLMSKPTIVTLPFVLLLLDYWPLRRWQAGAAPRLIAEKLPLIALSAVASVITLAVQKGAGAVASLGQAPFGLRVENALVSYLAYASQFLWPAKLAVIYPYANIAAWKAIGAAACFVAVTALAIAWRKRLPYFFTGWLWFAGALVPMIGLVQVGVQSRADRYMYLPLAGLAIADVWALAELAAKRAALRTAIAALACFALAGVAWPATALWQDTVTLFTHAVQVTTGNWPALLTLSQELVKENRVDEATPCLNELLRLQPRLAEAHIVFGSALSKRGELDAAAGQYRQALAEDPSSADAQEGLGVMQTEKGQLAEALTNLQAAAKSKPEDADAHYNLGRLYGLAGRADLAIPEFVETLRLQSDSATARFNLGEAYAAQERFAEASDQFREALRLKPDYLAARFNLGSALAELGRLDDAIVEFQEVLREQPDFPGAAQALETCLALKRSPHS